MIPKSVEENGKDQLDKLGEEIARKLSESAQTVGYLTIQTEDELGALVELLCHSKGAPGFDERIARLREEVVDKWESR